MKNLSANSVIPENELRCFWMDAGVAEYKLCDKEFHCEACSFNVNVLQENQEKSPQETQQDTQPTLNSNAVTAEALFISVLKKRIDHLRTIPIPLDRSYSRGQFWIMQTTTGSYRVGINHILANLFQPILSIVMSKAPVAIHKHDPFCWIIMPGGAITLRSPIDATITRFNPALQQLPNLLSAAPFQDGWIIEVTAKSKGLSNFASSSESQRFTKQTLHNVEQIFKKTFQSLQPQSGTTLFDGGVNIGSIESILGPTIYREVVNRITHFPS